MNNILHGRRLREITFALVVCGAATACGSSTASKPPPTVVPAVATSAAVTVTAARSGSIPETIKFSSFFGEGSKIPGEYSCVGNNTSPPLSWNGAPTETKAYVIFLDEPEAGGIFSHWVLYNLPGSVLSLPASVPANREFDDGTKQGTNSAGLIGYAGPCPQDRNLHRFQFFIFALDQPLDIANGKTKGEVITAMANHILARGTFAATFQR